jgi:hypothetical protein
MAFLLANVPYFRCYVRAEYVRDLQDGHGCHLSAIAHAVRCELGETLLFRVAFTEWVIEEDGTKHLSNCAGAMFSLLPLTALCWRPCPHIGIVESCPWNCFSHEFTVIELEFMKHMGVLTLPDRREGWYMFTIDYMGSSLSRDREQHKEHHVVRLKDGNFGAYPNNRLLYDEPAYCEATKERPPFVSLMAEFRSE